MIFEAIELFGFFGAVIVIGLVCYFLWRMVHYILGGGAFVILLLLLLAVWMPAPLEPFMAPLISFFAFLLDVALTTVLDGLNFVRNLG